MTVPLVETLPVGNGCGQWSVWGTVARIVVIDSDTLDTATGLVRAELQAVDIACSRFRVDSELGGVYRAAGRPVRVSPRLAELVAAALRAADTTDGDVDPTMGTALAALGYDRDFASLPGREHAAGAIAVFPVADWRQIRLDGDLLTVPVGTRLDLGATAKAWTADRCADIVARHCGTGVLVALGGDIVTAGAAPDGWDILVQDGTAEPACAINLPAGGAIATSSTISRSWRQGNQTLHHILMPQTGYPAPPIWRTVSVVADSCVDANTLSTAAIVRGHKARSWLEDLQVPARLVEADGSIVTCGGWPADESSRIP